MVRQLDNTDKAPERVALLFLAKRIAKRNGIAVEALCKAKGLNIAEMYGTTARNGMTLGHFGKWCDALGVKPSELLKAIGR